MNVGLCNNNGGQGAPYSHVCMCVREKGHEMESHDGRSHGCVCGALWRDAQGKA